ncbi:MAG: hypothetical protein A2X32_03330 [Elusimicrobia bacterium GWC2_64_44]|nr:MAG: hypothetical protein A2X32_03330 [Elusimicrobia bacterium GWC2_64_44]
MERTAVRPAALLSGLRYLGGLGWLSADAFEAVFLEPFRAGRRGVRAEPVFEQMARVGYASLGLVCLVQFFIGVVLALQMAYILKKFGVTEYVGTVVGLGMFRELGPLMTGVVMAGYAGAAISAELGTMAVSEEIEALRALAISPVRYLVAPRVLAAAVMIPCVTMVGDFSGVLGGLLTGWGALGVAPGLFVRKLLDGLAVSDVLIGVFKSLVFAVLISVISCREGLGVDSGAEGVGRAATRSVVYSVVAIIAADCFFTALFHALLGR